MASGVIPLNVSGSLKLTGQIVWNSTPNGAIANSSVVSASLMVYRVDGFTTTGTWAGNLNIGGDNRNFSIYAGVGAGWVTMTSFSTTVKHAPDGTCSCYIGGGCAGPAGTSLAGTSVSGDRYVTLDRILVSGITLTNAPNFTDEDNPTITYSNPAGTLAENAQACISLDGTKDDVVTWKKISATAGSYTFNLTESERNILRKNTANSKSRNVTFKVWCSVGGVAKEGSLVRTVTIANAEPTISPTVKDINAVTLGLTGNNQKLIRYYSNVAVAANAVANKYATIKSYQISCGNSKVNTATGTINNIETNMFTFIVTDSRGNVTTKNIWLDMLQYIKLTANLTTESKITTENKGSVDVRIEGNYFNTSFGAKQNNLTVKCRYKIDDGEYSAWQIVPHNEYNGTYSAEGLVTDFDYRSSCTIQASAEDLLTGVVYTDEQKLRCLPVFDWNNKSFEFHVPVSVQGNAVAFYPVGSIYLSINDVNPSVYFGGTWEKIEGSFLLASDNKHKAGTTGGSTTKKIEAKNLPGDTITLVQPGANKWSTGKWSNQDVLGKTDWASVPLNQNWQNNGGQGIGYDVPLDVTPPYFAINVWKRTA